MASYREHGTTENFEKRKLPRFPVQLPVQLGHFPNDLSSICTNLSRAGVSVESAQDFGVGERTAVAVTLAPKEEPLRMVGQVVWIRNLGAVDAKNRKIREIGIRFLRPLPSAQRFSEGSGEEDTSEFDLMEPTDLPDVPPADSI